MLPMGARKQRVGTSPRLVMRRAQELSLNRRIEGEVRPSVVKPEWCSKEGLSKKIKLSFTEVKKDIIWINDNLSRDGDTQRKSH